MRTIYQLECLLLVADPLGFARYTGATRSDEEFKWLADQVVERH